MLLLGLFLGKKCESQPAHLSIYTAHKTDHTLAPPAATERISCCQFRPRAKMFSFQPASSRYHLPITRTVEFCTGVQYVQNKNGPQAKK